MIKVQPARYFKDICVIYLFNSYIFSNVISNGKTLQKPAHIYIKSVRHVVIRGKTQKLIDN